MTERSEADDWFAAGGLSEAEFETLVKLAARYVRWDVDQSDGWLLPTPDGPFWVAFLFTPLLGDQSFHRPVWPPAADGAPAWTLTVTAPDGTQRVHPRYASREAAEAAARYAERLPGNAGTRYEITGPA